MLSVISLKLTCGIDTRCLKKERLRYILSFQSIKEMWGMHKAGIDLRSTPNFVLDRLQGSPLQFLMLHLSLYPPPQPPHLAKCWQSDLEETVDHVVPQINPIPFDSGHMGK